MWHIWKRGLARKQWKLCHDAWKELNIKTTRWHCFDYELLCALESHWTFMLCRCTPIYNTRGEMRIWECILWYNFNNKRLSSTLFHFFPTPHRKRAISLNNLQFILISQVDLFLYSLWGLLLLLAATAIIPQTHSLVRRSSIHIILRTMQLLWWFSSTLKHSEQNFFFTMIHKLFVAPFFQILLKNPLR